MSKSHDYIPGNDKEFNDWFKHLIQYVALKTSGTPPEWDHIPPERVSKLSDVYANWYTHYSITLKPHTKAQREAKNIAKAEAKKEIRLFVRQFLHFDPVTNPQRTEMQIPNWKTTRTPQNLPAEIVEFIIKLRGIRELIIHFKVLGAENKAKPKGYDGALIIWDILDKAPSDPRDLKRHTLASRTPYALNFTEQERGKAVYVCMAWQNRKSELGNFSEIQMAFVP